ncbi:leucine-rich repeat flightless-interacting protein 2 isoform X46 [Tachysurus vachellii]|uniref:leucine-rich repeat flightless-interacting protein 2 isoform X46 n=1 Tax=Tachysurus vachellii TaxID=175792 RepID=UPI00296AF9F4|nr:leucine-rich repeat flightless-interacting protein 2 isoform X46 [Tachysurus vachellii]
MASQGPGRRRTPNRTAVTPEEDALNVIAREAEARLAAKRAARAEAREIRMKELERQQKEIFQVQKKYYGLENLENKWGDIEQWMEDSERYTRHSERHVSVSDDEDCMSLGSKTSVRLDLESVDSQIGLSHTSLFNSHKSTKKKKKKMKISSDISNGNDNDYRTNSSRGSLYENSLSSTSLRSSSHTLSEYSGILVSSTRASSRASSRCASPVENSSSSVASFLRKAGSSSGLRDLDHVTVPDLPNLDDGLDRDFFEKGSSRASTLSTATLTSLGGASSRKGSGSSSVTADTETSLQDIKEIHELKDQIQDVEAKYMQSLKELKDSLSEMEEKYRKAMVSNAQFDNEKSNLMYEVDTLKDSLIELEELLAETRRECEEKSKDLEREKHAHSILQFQFNEQKETLKQSEELLTKHGIVLGPDLCANGEVEGNVSGGSASSELQHGSSVLEIRLRKLVDERENLIEQVKSLKEQLEQKKKSHKRDESCSPEGQVQENSTNPDVMEMQRDANRQVSDLKFKLVKSEQEVTALEQNSLTRIYTATFLYLWVTRLEGQVTRYKSAAENAEKVEDELKAEKRKLQRELRSALDKIEELEESNSHLNKRLEKIKAYRGTAASP